MVQICAILIQQTYEVSAIRSCSAFALRTATSLFSVDANKLCSDAQSDPKLAPTKEVISFRAYAASRRLNRLRRNACKMYQTEENARLIK